MKFVKIMEETTLRLISILIVKLCPWFDKLVIFFPCGLGLAKRAKVQQKRRVIFVFDMILNI